MDELQSKIWKQLLERAAEYTLQTDDPARWSKNFLNVDLYKNQEEIVSKVCDLNRSYLAILGARGSGKCSLGDTLLFTEKGIIEIQDLIPDTVHTDEIPLELNLSTKEGIETTSHFYNNGIKTTLNITTKQGFEFEGSYNHPLLCFTSKLKFKFKNLEDIKEGDYLCIQRGQQLFAKNKFKDIGGDAARFLGYLVAEGHFNNHDAITITNEDVEFIEDTSKVSKRLSLDFYYRRSSFHYRGIRPMLERWGIKKGLSNTKEIPKCILQSPKPILVEFLRAYFEGDGGVEIYTNKKGYTKGVVTCSTKSEKLAKQLQVVLTNFGIISKRYFTYKCATNTKNKTKRKYWTICISGENVDIFAKEIGFLFKEKSDKLLQITNKKRNTNTNIVPFISDQFTNLYNSISHEHSKKGVVTGRKLLSYFRNGQKKNVSYNSLKEISNTLVIEKEPQLKNTALDIFSKNYFFDKVVSIKKGRAQTYDLTVPGSHSFTSNGFISHNSFGTCIGLIKLCQDYPGLEIGLFAPRADQANRLVSESKKVLAIGKLGDEVNWDKTTTDKLTFRNGSNILALSAAETSLQEGWHFAVVVVDEAHRVSNMSMSERIMPMLGSKKIFKLVKIGIPMFKNHFYKSFSDDKYEPIVHDWLASPILLESGFKEIKNDTGKLIKYPVKVLDRMPRSLKIKMFPSYPELHYDGDMTEIEFNTQYGMIWMDNINSFLQGDEPEKLIGAFPTLTGANAGEDYFFGLDTSSGTLMPGKYDLDYTALSIWRKRGDLIKEKVACFQWQGGETLSQLEQVAGIVHPHTGIFPCKFGCIDYSNVGITAVEMFKRLKIPAAGVIFSATDSVSKKNYKNAMADHFKFELQADRVKYPRMEDIESHKVFRKHYHELLALECHAGVSLNSKICAPPGIHDDGSMSDFLGVYASDKSQTFKKISSTYRIPGTGMPRSIVGGGMPGRDNGKRFLK